MPNKPARSLPKKSGRTGKAPGADPSAPANGAPEDPAALTEYWQKRDSLHTPEPFGGARRAPVAAARALTFVVHKHDARNLHYDLRLELDGTLKSWAVPKGPSTHVEEKRLAVHVEDHPLEYGSFEGNIPEGNYGAGSVIIWDRGWYRSFKPEPLLEQYSRGKLELELFGFKLRGRWTLVRMGKKDKEWLLLKKAGAGASDVELIERYPQSVVCGLTVEEMADPEAKVATVRADLERLGAARRAVRAKGLTPMLATLEEQPFDREGWIFEIKYDGVRVIAGREGDQVELYGRSGQSITARYPEIAEALRALPFDSFVLDGEIVAPDEGGQPSFQHLQHRMHLVNKHDIERARTQAPVVAMFFDCLALMGHDLRRSPLVDRKECMRQVVPALGAARYGGHIERLGMQFFEAAGAMKLEGIVAKRAESSYVSTRSRDWIKIKCQHRQEFVIGGWTDPQGSRGHFGALDVGVYEPGAPPGGAQKLVYVTAVGTGFDRKGLKLLWEKLLPLARESSPFSERSPKDRGHHWVEPTLVCEVRYTEWTRDGGLRHPTFIGLREDKSPAECVRERAPVFEAEPAEEPAANANPEPADRPRTVQLSNLKKVFWPADGYTKGDLIAYYDAIAPHILTYLRDRPIFLTRYPDGIEGKSFYQKDAPVFTPDWVRTVMIRSSDGERANRFFVVNDPESLRYLANLGAIPIHMWSSRVASIECPDWMILDLDPKGAPFAHVIQVAHTLHRILDDLALPSFPKTSGASGLHILVPLAARYTYEQSRSFARLLAIMAVEEQSKIATVVRQVDAREGKVYVDFGQNGHGQSIVSPFCVRPLPGAPVSCPLLWKEVNARLDPAKYTIKTAPARFAKMEDPMAEVLGAGIRMDEAIRKMERRMRGEA